MSQLKKRQKDILKALESCGGIATMKEISELTNLHLNGVSQSLSALSAKKYVLHLQDIEGVGGKSRWAIRTLAR